MNGEFGGVDGVCREVSERGELSEWWRGIGDRLDFNFCVRFWIVKSNEFVWYFSKRECLLVDFNGRCKGGGLVGNGGCSGLG